MPTSSVKRVLKVPSDEQPTSKQTSVTLVGGGPDPSSARGLTSAPSKSAGLPCDAPAGDSWNRVQRQARRRGVARDDHGGGGSRRQPDRSRCDTACPAKSR